MLHDMAERLLTQTWYLDFLELYRPSTWVWINCCSQKFVFGILQRPEGLKFKAEGREWGRSSWGGDSEPPPHQLESWGSAVSILDAPLSPENA